MPYKILLSKTKRKVGQNKTKEINDKIVCPLETPSQAQKRMMTSKALNRKLSQQKRARILILITRI